MTLDTAIEVLADMLGQGPYHEPDERREAVRLGIEALRRLQRHRDYLCQRPNDTLLPGETEEEK